MNAAWHERNPMPARATLEQRCRWHVRHAKACGCRPIPASVRRALTNPERRLQDLAGIGRAMLGDFELLGIRSVAQLAEADPKALYDRLCQLTFSRQDPCVLDTFACAVAQARDPRLPREQCNWWWWSRKRKAAERASLNRKR